MEGSKEGNPVHFDAAQEATRHVDMLRNRERLEQSQPIGGAEFDATIKPIVEQAMSDDQRFWPFVDKLQLVVREHVKRERMDTETSATKRKIDERDQAATVMALDALTQLAQHPTPEARQAFARAMAAAPLSGSRVIESNLIRNLT